MNYKKGEKVTLVNKWEITKVYTSGTYPDGIHYTDCDIRLLGVGNRKSITLRKVLTSK